MGFDKNAYYEDGSYLIKSLYFDDIESSSYYEKMDGVLYRKKYRIRMYNDDDSYIRLEKKMKHNNYTAKEQMLISKDIYSKILKGNLDDISNPSGLLEEFITDIKNKGLIPSVVVMYHRTAYTYPISEVRITFDSNIESGLYNYDLFDNEMPTYNLDEKGKQVLEVKFNEVLPLHIANILNDIPSCREAVSKFAICRSIK
jgi:SPX domain protein involved in polyphosphate accumulation